MPEGYRTGHMQTDAPRQYESHKAPDAAPADHCGAGAPARVGRDQGHED